jgi:hypothetical protein
VEQAPRFSSLNSRRLCVENRPSLFRVTPPRSPPLRLLVTQESGLIHATPTNTRIFPGALATFPARSTPPGASTWLRGRRERYLRPPFSNFHLDASQTDGISCLFFNCLRVLRKRLPGNVENGFSKEGELIRTC